MVAPAAVQQMSVRTLVGVVLLLPATESRAWAQDESVLPTPVGCDSAYSPVRLAAEEAVRKLALDGAAVLIRKQGRVVCEAYLGAYNAHTTVPVVSAAKWLSAATILTLVDAGDLHLDDSVSRYLPSFTGAKGGITLRQLLSHTSGLPAYDPCMFRPELTLEMCANKIAADDLLAPPGKQFDYGGAAYTVAGRMAEVAAGSVWQDLFEARLAYPLGLQLTEYGETRNPMLSEGRVVSTLREFGAFLQMVLNGGEYQGRRILSPEAVTEMRRDQTAGVRRGSSPRSSLSYGLGVWRDVATPDGLAQTISSPGGGGFVPWVDFERGIVGIFMAFDRIERIWPYAAKAQRAAREAIDRERKNHDHGGS